MTPALRTTDTNAASDSAGKTWGLEGNLFWFLVGGLGAGITVFFLLIVLVETGLLMAFVGALVPVLASLIYIFGFRQGKPPGYDRDILAHWLKGPGFAPAPFGRRRLQHPLADRLF